MNKVNAGHVISDNQTLPIQTAANIHENKQLVLLIHKVKYDF